MIIELSLFYYIYLGLVFVFLLFAFFNFYHLIRFGGFSIAVLVMAIFYALGTIAILLLSWWAIREIDWTQTIQLITPLGIKL